MSPQELTRLAAKRVGLNVPDEHGEGSGEAGKAAAVKLHAVKERLEAEHAMAEDGGADDEEARARGWIRVVAAKAQAALAGSNGRVADVGSAKTVSGCTCMKLPPLMFRLDLQHGNDVFLIKILCINADYYLCMKLPNLN